MVLVGGEPEGISALTVGQQGDPREGDSLGGQPLTVLDARGVGARGVVEGAARAAPRSEAGKKEHGEGGAVGRHGGREHRTGATART